MYAFLFVYDVICKLEENYNIKQEMGIGTKEHDPFHWAQMWKQLEYMTLKEVKKHKIIADPGKTLAT